MKKVIVITLILLVISPAFASDKKPREEVPVFTDDDLERYKHPYDKTESSKDSKPPIEEIELKDILLDSKKSKKKPKWHEVPYTAYEGSERRIIIPVTVNGTVTVPMLLDTGAPGMHISYKLAEKLGALEKDEGKLLTMAGGIGGQVPAIITVIDKIQIGGAVDHFIPATVSDSPIFQSFEGLIGMDFMANYDMQLDTQRHVVVFVERPPEPHIPGGHDENWWRSNFRRFASMKTAWEKYREFLYDLKDNSQKIRNFREYADKQCIEAEKLLNKLNSYAIDYAVPMEWREY